jgi:uncharacterized membrane protein YphA (DoxX/SURF4 family)
MHIGAASGMTKEQLIWVACALSAGIWIFAGLYKITHIEKMVGVIRAHSIPLPRLSFWLSVSVELGGSILLLVFQQIWIPVVLWLGFMFVATPLFHGHVFRGGAIDYPQFVQIGKNISIAGGLIALLLLDRNFSGFFFK